VLALREVDPRRIGPYEVLGRLGAGGMGEVYLAEAPTGLRLAVKVVRSEHAEDRTFRARFRHEVRAARTVGGAGTYTARVVDADTEAERPWMASEFVEGPNLRDAVLDGGPLHRDAVRVLAAALGQALAAIHAKGLVHRDLKPSNILLAPDGPRVIDFGIVRALEATALTNTGAVVGSVGYVSPEQIRNGAEVGPPSDVFSLGAVLAYAAAGREPFGEGQDSVILLRILTRDFVLSGVPDEVRPLVEACLRENPAERPTPAQVVAAVGHTAESLRRSARPGWFDGDAGSGPRSADGDATLAPKPTDSDERWLPERDSGERLSRVEYVAPVTVTDAPTPAPDASPPPATHSSPPPVMDGPVTVAPHREAPGSGPSRRGLLRALAGGGAVVAAAGGVGGWLWLREPDGARDNGSSSARGGGSTSPAATTESVPASVLWRAPVGEPANGAGPCAAVSPDERTVYVSADDGTLHAVGADGTERWKLTFTDPSVEYVSLSPPAVTPDGTVHVIVGPIGAGDSGELVAVSPAGKRKWARKLPGNYGYDAPVVDGDMVLVTFGDPMGAPGGVRAYMPDGYVMWTGAATFAPNTAPLVVDNVVYVGGYDDCLHAFDLANGSELWKASLGSDVARPAVAGDMIAVSTNDHANYLYGVSVDGRRRWKKKGRGGGYTSYTTAVGSLFLAVVDGTLLATGTDGTARWTYRGSGSMAEPAARKDVIYVKTGAELHAVDLKGSRRWRLEVGSQGANMISPVLAGDRLYTVSLDGLVAVGLKT
jgi:eukaryotic-like serine/threonine-protein kinase